jgi:hypothetical protein
VARKVQSKYKARKKTVDGIKFDSTKEANRYTQLLLMQRAGEISKLRHHPRFPLTCGSRPVMYQSNRAAYYEADFEYTLPDGRVVVEDVKGYDTQVSKLKRAVLRAETGIVVKIV